MSQDHPHLTHQWLGVWLSRLMALLLVLMLFGAGAFADSTPDKQLDSIRSALDTVEASLKRPDLSDTALAALQSELTGLSTQTAVLITATVPKLKAVTSRLAQLAPVVPVTPGPPVAPVAPAAPSGTPPPRATVAPAAPSSATAALTSERDSQQKEFARLDSLLKRANALQVEIGQTSRTVQERRNSLFASRLFAQSYSVLQPHLWMRVAADTRGDMRAFGFLVSDWTDALSDSLGNAGGPLILLLLLGLLGTRALSSILQPRLLWGEASAAAPAGLRKSSSRLATALLIIAIPVAYIFAARLLLNAFHLTESRIDPVLRAFVGLVLRLAFVGGLAQALLSPRDERWRMINFTQAGARLINARLLLLALILGLSHLLAVIADAISADLSVTIAILALGALAFAVVLGATLRQISPAASGEMRATTLNNFFEPLRLILWVAVGMVGIALIGGYVSFAAFICDQILRIGLIFAAAYLLRAVAADLLETSLQPKDRLGAAIMLNLGMRESALRQGAVLASGITHLAIYGLAFVALLSPLGIQSDNFQQTLQAAYFGFSVGGVMISPSRIVVALALFGITLALTRTFQRWLDLKFLPATRLDRGLRTSIRTSLGYIGFTIAVGLALGQMGLDFARLALVAGALSVGIGFGLQSIVNNFVSGLILLWERVIQEGDWIVVGDDQGFVRRINVRSTEIETFDRLTVIVPNSSLVAEVVKNWVRHDKIGRIKISLTLAMDSPLDEVHDLLIACAKAQPQVLRIPAPSVIFADIAASSVKFDFYCYVDDVEISGRVRSELLFDMHRRFREANLLRVLAPTARSVVSVEHLETIAGAWVNNKGQVTPETPGA